MEPIGVLIIWAKVGDIFGRKLISACAIILFIIFSGACGAAQTMIQLYVFVMPLIDSAKFV